MPSAIDRREFALLPYQAALIEAIGNHDVVVVEKSRRIGFSYTLAALAVMTAGASPQLGMRVYYMGYNQDMTRQFINDCSAWGKMINRILPVEEVLFRDKANPDKDILTFRIMLDSHEIVALPSVARSLRSLQGLVILDEAAFYDDLDGVIKAAMALLMWGGKVVILSTHNGADNPFHRLIKDINQGRLNYHHIRVTLDDALAGGLYKRICKTQGKVWSLLEQATWRDALIQSFHGQAEEELFCIPQASGGAWISRQILENCAAPDIPVLRYKWDSADTLATESRRQEILAAFYAQNLAPIIAAIEGDRYARLDVGQDFARSQDISCLVVGGVGRDLVRRVIFVLELRNMPYTTQAAIVAMIIDALPKFHAAAFDASGNGGHLAEATAQRYGSARVYQDKLTAPWYGEHMTKLKGALEDGHWSYRKMWMC